MKDTNQPDESWKPNKEAMLSSTGNPITQGLFLEIGYGSNAQYTLKERDHVHKGTLYPSLKRLYVEMDDPGEYEFANKYLLGWSHWERMCANGQLAPHIESWRQELEIKLLSKAAKQIMGQAKKGSFQATKWMADKGWVAKSAGRPSKEEMERRASVQEQIDDIYAKDFLRVVG